MNEQWKQWEGQTLDGKFLLRRFIASTGHSVVFLTQLSAPEPREAVLKLIPADTPGRDARLSLWKRASQLSHTNLIAIYDFGQCSLNGRSFLYVVMEYAEENLGEILPQRALSAEETREVLNPALDVLVYLHSKGLAHGHLKPSNLLATQDCLKLSSDALLVLDAPSVLVRSRDIYDAPELPSSPPSPASDVWSLGTTLAEALTQRPPELSENPAADPMVPRDLPELFADIARHSLRHRPEQRWSVAEIAARLNPAPLAAVAVAASAVAVPTAAPRLAPVSLEPAVPLSKLPPVAESTARSAIPGTKPKPSSPFDYVIPGLLGVAVFFGLILAIPKLLNFRGQSAPRQAALGSQPTSDPQPVESFKTPEARPPREKPVAAHSGTPGSAIAAPAKKPDLGPPPRTSVKPAGDVERQGEVLDQVLPKPALKALATIQGTLRVIVNVRVDGSGNVVGTNLQTPGPSRYFADLSEKAARQWKFSGAESDGHGVPSEWQIRFEFLNSGVHAYPKQTTP